MACVLVIGRISCGKRGDLRLEAHGSTVYVVPTDPESFGDPKEDEQYGLKRRFRKLRIKLEFGRTRKRPDSVAIATFYGEPTITIPSATGDPKYHRPKRKIKELYDAVVNVFKEFFEKSSRQTATV